MAQTKGGMTILREAYHTLPLSERKIADCILENPEYSIESTALKLGEKSNTSSAAVIRLCKSLGFKGFQELKIRVAGDLQAEEKEHYRDIKPKENHNDVISKVTANTIKTIRETVAITQSQNIQKVINALMEANTITFIGFGASKIAALDAEQKFLRINKWVQSFSDVHMAATYIANKGPNDVLVGISFSGDTHEVANLMNLAQQREVQTISITKYGQSLVQKYSDIQLYTSAAREATFRSGATSSRIAQLHMIDIIFMCVASEEYDETVQYLNRTRNAVSFLKSQQSKDSF